MGWWFDLFLLLSKFMEAGVKGRERGGGFGEGGIN